MRVLIVDDEIKVCNLIQNLVDWQALGLEIVGVANDGEAALRAVNALAPDIVITDIRMPGYSGIELIKEVRETNGKIHFIIVSGYRQFEYASQAIKYGVEDYLLKPLKQAEIEKILAKIVRRHEEALARDQEHEDIEQRMTRSVAQLHEYFLQILMDDEKWKSLEMSRQAIGETYHVCFGKSAYRMLMLQMLVKKDPLEANANLVLCKKGRSILENHLEQEFAEVIAGIHNGVVVCLINDEPERLAKLPGTLRRTLGGLSSLKDIFGPIDATMALSGIISPFEDLRECVREARVAAMQHIFLPGDTIIEYSQAYMPVEEIASVLDNAFRVRFRKNITTLENSALHNAFEEAHDLLQGCHPSGALVVSGFERLIGFFMDAMSENGVALPENFREDCLERLRAARSLREGFAELEKDCASALDAWKAARSEEAIRPIRQAKLYIQERYAEPLTLNLVSAVVGLSPSYFSMVFKRETGRNFVDYLLEVRMEAAKELLVGTNLGIGEIAEKVGYNDMKYFYKRFKQSMGVSLREYRKLYN